MPDKKLSRKRMCVCPICCKYGWAFYPYGEFVIRHEHPVRRYWYWLRTGRKYSIWLTEYWSDMERLTEKSRKDYA